MGIEIELGNDTCETEGAPLMGWLLHVMRLGWCSSGERLVWAGWRSQRTCQVTPTRRDYDPEQGERRRPMVFGAASSPGLGVDDCLGRSGLAAKGAQRYAHAVLLAV